MDGKVINFINTLPIFPFFLSLRRQASCATPAFLSQSAMRHLLVPFLMSVLLLTACAERRTPATSIEGFALGTVYSVTVADRAPDSLRQRVEAIFAEADTTLSVFNENSLLSRLNRNETDRVNDDIARNIALARSVSELSGGRYDITILPLVEAYGFLNDPQHEGIDIDSVLQYVGYRKIDVRDGRLVKQYPQTRIDLNSIAKGYIVDRVAAMLESEGSERYLVNIGGEIFCRGTNPSGKPWSIAIDTPYEGNYIPGEHTMTVLHVSGVGVATSGNYRNFHTGEDGTRYTHIIDPITGRNTASNLLSATVIAESCARADALGTMFIALGLDDALALLQEHPDIAALLIYAQPDGSMKIHTSEAMQQYL